MDTHTPRDETSGTSFEQGAPPPGSAPPTGESSSGPTPGADQAGGSGFFGAVRRLDVQRTDDRWIAGVCTGLANRTGLDPLLWRGLFAVSLLIGGIGLVLYGVAWALLPERRDGRIHLEELFAGRFDAAVVGAFAFMLIGLGRGGNVFPLWFWGGAPHWVDGFASWIGGLVWIAFIAGSIVAIVVALNRRNASPPAPPAPAGPYGPFPARPATPGPYATYPAQQPAGSPTRAYPGAASAPTAAPYAATYPGPTHHGRAAQPPTSPKPVKPSTPGPGVAATGIVVALSLIALAILLAAERADHFTAPLALTAVGITVLLAGLGVVVSGFRGRSSGVLGFLAIMGILVAMPLGAATTSQWDWSSDGMHRFAGDVDLTVTSRTEAADGFALGFGQADIDLTGVPMTSDLLEVPIAVGAGDLTVVVPDDAAVTADVRVRAGEMNWDVDDTQQHSDGVSTDTRTYTDDASQNGAAQLNLQISVGAGSVTVIREDS